MEQFNCQEKQFHQKCEYFKDYETDVLKYYSLKKNLELHEKLKLQEIQLRVKYEDLSRKKQEYQ